MTACAAMCDLSAPLRSRSLDPEHVALGRAGASVVCRSPEPTGGSPLRAREAAAVCRGAGRSIRPRRGHRRGAPRAPGPWTDRAKEAYPWLQRKNTAAGSSRVWSMRSNNPMPFNGWLTGSQTTMRFMG